MGRPAPCQTRPGMPVRTRRLTPLLLLPASLIACSGQHEETDEITRPVPARSTTAASAAPDDSSALGPAVLDQLQALAREKRSRTPAQRKLASQLVMGARLRRGDVTLGASTLAALAALPNQLSNASANGMVKVDVRAHVDAAVLGHIKQLGGKVLSSVPRFRTVQALMPIDALDTLAALPQVSTIVPALGAVTNKVDTSEGDVAHATASARAQYSVTGAGVTVGVLSDGVDTLAARQASGDLPNSPQLTVLSGQAGTGDEGTAMLEIVHDLAPGAKLIFATAFEGDAEFAQNIIDLQAAGCDVIVDDVSYLAEAVYQDDIIAQAVNTVTNLGALYFSSAGNDGNLTNGTASNYEGDYAGANDATLKSLIEQEGSNATWLDVHTFATGVRSNRLTSDPTSWVTLQWSDPFAASTNDYDLFLINNAQTNLQAYSTASQSGTQPPLEALDLSTGSQTNSRLVIARWSGSARAMRLSTHRATLAVQTTGEVWGHSAAVNAFAVAAVRASTAMGGVFTGGAANPVEYFSSDGPRRVFFQPNGTPLTPGNFLLSNGGVLRNKPDLAAADGVSTATPGFNPFYGTSAAAPHAAALAALLLEKRPDIKALSDASASSTFRTIANASTLDIESAGFDVNSGAGILMADLLLDPCHLEGAACDDGNACTQVDTCVAGQCVGSSPVTCSASDQCHDLGTCDPATGLCSDPQKPNGSPCNDGDLCTTVDTCQGGSCSSTPVVCAASDQCHDAGTCDPATGLCSNPQKPDDTVCNDGSLCTAPDTCQGGSCVGTLLVVCSASDQCHDVGTCNPGTGVCSNPAKPNDTPCNDGALCTTGDSCQGGTCSGSPVVCAASDQCHDVGTCDPGSGNCSNPQKPNDSACDDGDLCTTSDTCQGGTCSGANPVVCSALDQCHVAGICDPDTGDCSDPAKPNDTACDDASQCTSGETCQAGVCTAAVTISCSASDQCHDVGTCDPLTGECSDPMLANDTGCDDDNPCTTSDSCQSGVCTGFAPTSCPAADECHLAGSCNPSSGACSTPTAPNGTACSGGECLGGVCTAITVDQDSGVQDAGNDASTDAASDAAAGGEGDAGSGAQGGQGGNGAGNAGDAQGGSAGDGQDTAGAPSKRDAGLGGSTPGNLDAGLNSAGDANGSAGCGCALPGRTAPSDVRVALLLGLLFVAARRRRENRRAA